MATAAERERLRRIVFTAPHHFQQSHRWRRVQPIRAEAASAKSEIELAAEPGPQRRADAVGAVGDAFLPDTLGSSRDFVARAELPPEALEAEVFAHAPGSVRCGAFSASR